MGHVPFTGLTHWGKLGVLEGTLQQISPTPQQLPPQQNWFAEHVPASASHGGMAAQVP